MRILRFSFLMVLTAAGHADTPPLTYDPVSAYETETMQGFTVLIHRQVLAHANEAEDARAELEKQLQDINRVVPAGALAELRRVRIWVEWGRKQNGAAEFHPSAQWLQNHGYNPEKAGNIEINNTRNFVAWSRRAQPCMILHELAHAYQFLLLRDQEAGLAAAFKQAVDRGVYDEVDYVGGGKKRAYALTNAKEYFAELSEAYFGRNDFYPFTRSELKAHDPAGYAFLEKVWGERR